MLTLAKGLVIVGVLWAVILLAAQVVVSRGARRRDYSRRAGMPGRGLLYGFTVAMLPAHKESVGRHPLEFATGMIMHAGVLIALLSAVLLVAWPEAGFLILGYTRPLILVALLAGVGLLVRRAVSTSLRSMSAADDYVAIIATCGLILLAGVRTVDSATQVPLLVWAGLLLLYMPLGKLRHAVFFFVARGEHVSRLGYRGVYPPPPVDVE